MTHVEYSFSTKTSDTEKYFYNQVGHLIAVTVERLRYVACQNIGNDLVFAFQICVSECESLYVMTSHSEVWLTRIDLGQVMHGLRYPGMADSELPLLTKLFAFMPDQKLTRQL